VEWPAPAALRPAVTCLWARVIPESSEIFSSVVLPDAASDLIWEQGKGSFVAGPDTGPAPAHMTPGTILFGVRLKSWAGGPVLGLPLSEVRDQRVPLADLGQRDVPGTLDPYPAVERMLDLAGRLITGSTPDPEVTHAASLLRDPRIQVEDVARETGVSVRQLRRRFHAAVGYGPKTLQRVLRFHRFVTQIDTSHGTIDLAGLAADLGYADQAHLTRECVVLAGVTPLTLRTIRGTG
jgi:AraC-like DNA-binding protein